VNGDSVSEVIRKAIKDAHWAALQEQAATEMAEMMADPEQVEVMDRVRRDMDAITAW
jgi:hypothetical protein